jgi:hypothetical protein
MTKQTVTLPKIRRKTQSGTTITRSLPVAGKRPISNQSRNLLTNSSTSFSLVAANSSDRSQTGLMVASNTSALTTTGLSEPWFTKLLPVQSGAHGGDVDQLQTTRNEGRGHLAPTANTDLKRPLRLRGRDTLARVVDWQTWALPVPAVEPVFVASAVPAPRAEFSRPGRGG